ncbi:MAG TPA: hypothetical protein VKW06_00500 [Candidatus Angelobacter sp.]|nr:hypothetical protein [Candidatus Angelobacter sp.]
MTVRRAEKILEKLIRENMERQPAVPVQCKSVKSDLPPAPFADAPPIDDEIPDLTDYSDESRIDRDWRRAKIW